MPLSRGRYRQGLSPTRRQRSTRHPSGLGQVDECSAPARREGLRLVSCAQAQPWGVRKRPAQVSAPGPDPENQRQSSSAMGGRKWGVKGCKAAMTAERRIRRHLDLGSQGGGQWHSKPSRVVAKARATGVIGAAQLLKGREDEFVAKAQTDFGLGYSLELVDRNVKPASPHAPHSGVCRSHSGPIE
eukprot:scaffold298461_cov35-Tisochrysis_lutea.AAC.3